MTRLGRRRFLGGVAAGTIAVGATRAEASAEQAAALARQCQPLTGLTFDAAEQQQMLAAVDDIVERARGFAALRLDNDLCPAELFDPRLPDWTVRDWSLPDAPPPQAPPMPATGEDIAFAPAWQLSAWMDLGKLSARSLVDIYLDRIAARAGRLDCFAAVVPDHARGEAVALDRERAAGRVRGPLHGLPYGLKDLIDTAGITTAWGARPYMGRTPDKDATIVTRLREAGAILLAKTSCGAIAYGDIWYGGTTRNPWNVAEGSSGSSAGSAAAVADGLCAFAIGTETMGSIVAPSARCGTVGLRPTFGRVPRTGAMALCWSLDKIGVLARDARDTAAVTAAMIGGDRIDPCAIDEPLPGVPHIKPAEVTIGYRQEWFDQGNDVDRAALAAARRAGFRMVEIAMPDVDLNRLGGIVVLEAAAAFEELTASNKDAEMVWQDAIAWPNSWRAAHFETAVNYLQAQRTRRLLMRRFADTVKGVDAILHPNDAGGLLATGNHCGYPALVIPAGMLEQPTRQGFTAYVQPDAAAEGAELRRVPFTVTLTGRLFDEARLIAIGQYLSDEIGLGIPRPPSASASAG